VPLVRDRGRLELQRGQVRGLLLTGHHSTR
jgi:hypothetical protein